jgi:hypothetical protein
MAQTLYARTVTADAHDIRGTARDVTGLAEQQRKIARRKLVYRVAFVTFLVTTMLIWFTI